MDISSVEQYIGYTVASEIMKEALGDGMEYELVFQALMDQMQTNNTSSSENNEKNNIISTSSAISLDSLPLIRRGDESTVYRNNSLTYSLSDLSSLVRINTNNDYYNTTTEDVQLSDIYNIVNKYSEIYNVDPALVLAVIKAESNFDPNATSGAGAQGLMQVMDFNLEALGVTNGYDIDENIRAGVSILKSYLDDCGGDVSMALMAYNAGPGTMMNRGVTSADELYKMPSETQNYVPKVLNYYKEYKG